MDNEAAKEIANGLERIAQAINNLAEAYSEVNPDGIGYTGLEQIAKAIWDLTDSDKTLRIRVENVSRL